MVTAKKLISQPHRDKFFAAFDRECQALHAIWTDPKFPYKMMAYLLALNQQNRNMISQKKKEQSEKQNI